MRSQTGLPTDCPAPLGVWRAGDIVPAVADLDILRLFDRLIIGPSPTPLVMYQAFVEELTHIGVAEAAQRVVISGIPLRA